MDKTCIMTQILIAFLILNSCSCYPLEMELYNQSKYSTLNYNSTTCIGDDFKNMKISTSHLSIYSEGNYSNHEIKGITSARLLNLDNKTISYPLICTKTSNEYILCDFQPENKMIHGTYAFNVPEFIVSNNVKIRPITSVTNFTVADAYTENSHSKIFQLFDFSKDEETINIKIEYKNEIKNQKLYKFILNEKEVKCEIKDKLIVICPFTKEFFDSKEGKYKGGLYNPCGKLTCDVEAKVSILNGYKYGGDSIPIYIQIILLVGGVVLIGAIITVGICFYKHSKKKKPEINENDCIGYEEEKEDDKDQNGIGLAMI